MTAHDLPKASPTQLMAARDRVSAARTLRLDAPSSSKTLLYAWRYECRRVTRSSKQNLDYSLLSDLSGRRGRQSKSVKEHEKKERKRTERNKRENQKEEKNKTKDKKKQKTKKNRKNRND